jgi:uncharacterized protein (DUF736 family)
MSETINTKGKDAQVEIGALWKKQGQSQKFLSGTIKRSTIPEGKEDIQIVVFSNKFKKADNHPDLRIYISKPRGDATPTKATASSPVEVSSSTEENDEVI